MRRTPPKNPKHFTHFLIGNIQNIKLFFVRHGEEDMEIPQNINRF